MEIHVIFSRGTRIPIRSYVASKPETLETLKIPGGPPISKKNYSCYSFFSIGHNILI